MRIEVATLMVYGSELVDSESKTDGHIPACRLDSNTIATDTHVPPKTDITMVQALEQLLVVSLANRLKHNSTVIYCSI